jgi:CheY-like chemotaxis protein
MQKTILLIEDNADIRENTAELIELENYRVLTAENGLEGIRLAQLNLPDLVICDVLMKEADGYTVFRTLLQGEATCHIPFIFITAKSENADRLKAMSIGDCHYLVKPFDEKELFACIQKLLIAGSPGKTM